MNIGRGLKLAAVFLALGVTVTSAQLLVGRQTTQNGGGSDGRANPPSNQTTAVMEIKRGTLRVNVVERGSIVSGQNLDVLNAVEGESIIRGIVPEGTYVKKGDLVCELDSSTLKDQLRNQEATTNQAKRNLEEARNELEVADLEQRAFEQIELPLRKESIEGRIALGKVELELRKSQAEQVERMPEATALMKAESRLAVLRAEQGLKEAQGQLRLLQEFTRESETRRHQIKSTKARTHVLASEAAFQLEKSKTDKLQQQIAKCKLTAPADGLVVYASAPVASPGGRRFMIEEGATVRERQVIFSLFDPKTPARVMVKAREAIVDRLVPGLRAQVKVDAFADLVLSGTVQSVAPLPDPSNQFATQGRKVYSTLILLDKAFPSLRPGMTAQADILVKELNHVLTVPVQALLPRGNKYKIAVRKPDGSFTWRDVTLGMANDTHVEIKAGLNPGDVVSLAPLELLQDQAPTRPTPPAQPGEGRQP